VELPTVDDLDELTRIVERTPGVYVRYSFGPDRDDGTTSTDYESGHQLPGLSANPLNPEPWWTERPVREWVAKQLCDYAHLGEQDDERCAWVLRGREVGRGPDNEPLVELLEPLCWLGKGIVEQAKATKPHSERPEDQPEAQGG
jgi:hypothetical protein